MKATDFKVGSRYYFHNKNVSGEFAGLDEYGDPDFINVVSTGKSREYLVGSDGVCRFFAFNTVAFEPVESETGEFPTEDELPPVI